MHEGTDQQTELRAGRQRPLYCGYQPNEMSNESCTESLNQSCVSNFREMTPEFISLSFGLGIIVLLTVLGNLMVLCAVAKSRSLRSPTHIFMVNLAVADLLLGTLVLPFSAALEVTQTWYFGVVFCDVWAAVDVLCCTASILSLCAISVDRYIGVTRPLNYSAIMTHRLAIAICLTVWFLSLIISIGPLMGWKQPHNDPSVCDVTKELGYVIFSVTGSFYVPMFIILAVYWQIYKAAVKQTKFLKSGVISSADVQLRVHRGKSVHHHSEERKLSTAQNLSRTNVTSECYLAIPSGEMTKNRSFCNGDGALYTERRCSDISAQHCRESVSEGSPYLPGRRGSVTFSSAKKMAPLTAGLSSRIAKFRREKKAAKTLGIVVGAFLICWFPFFFILPLGVVCPNWKIPPEAFAVTFWLGYVNSCLNPFIYAATSRDFKRAFRQLICGRRGNHHAREQYYKANAQYKDRRRS